MAIPFGAGLLMAGGLATVSVAVSANTNNINLFTLCGSPTVAGNYTVTINSGITVGSTSTSTAAVVTGTFPAGSTVRLVNNGNIYGKEGSGAGPSATGGAAGPAISLGVNLTIDNTAVGKIFGGGGGGGGGGTGIDGKTNYSGGNGGSGRGAGNQSGPSAGSAGGTNAGAGGTGGDWGAAGSPGGNGNVGVGGSGGAAGKAIALNGFTANFTAGNNAAQVKGAVS